MQAVNMLEDDTRPREHLDRRAGGTERVPAVSVIMDVSQGERYLHAALASLAVQSFDDFEIVLCAHGATERTSEIIAAWQAREPRLRVLRHDRMSLSRAHNVAARTARAPLLARLDADDVAMPHRLRTQVRLFHERPELCLLGSAVELIDMRGRSMSVLTNPISDHSIRAILADACPIVHSTLMMRADAFWRAGGYREGLNTSEDYDLFARMLEASEGANCSEPLVGYRVHTSSLTSSRPLRMAITNLIVQSAMMARARGEPEPFTAGLFSMRKAQGILGLSRAELRLRLRATAWQSNLSRAILMVPAPFRLNAKARQLALRMGLRPAYSAAIRIIAAAVQRWHPAGSRHG